MPGREHLPTFGWKTGLLECMMLSYQKRRSLSGRLDSGRRVVFRYRGDQYHVDCDYSRFDFEVNAHLVDESVATIRRIFQRFDRVIVLRVPVKQDLLYPLYSNSHLAETIQNYEIGWGFYASVHRISTRSNSTSWTNSSWTTFTREILTGTRQGTRSSRRS